MPQAEPLVRCSVAAELAGDPMEASAPPADRWLLVEHAGPWGRHALTESGLHPDVAAALAGWTMRNRARVSLVRRPRSAHRRAARGGRWYLVDARQGAEAARHGMFADEHELLAVIEDPAAGEPHDEPLYLVCTHGRHDTCCALRGRPVADALASAYPDRTWECTHIGGDRFAANLVILPHGLFYGRVPPRHAVDLVRLHESGHVDRNLLRGRSSVPAPAQAAQAHARLLSGDETVDGHPVLACDAVEQGTWRVRLGGDTPLTVTVRARMVDAGRPLTCSATMPDRYRVFDVLDLRPGS